ncbi:unnamed protein product [Pneumocystis jirovecii]|uniref:Protein kinase domain-containing protein n=1 Tax=Pneumocystis jirovecii TaxID=42068 RepID=L0P7X4_PNEJI|nr:unnamed protein product [Pneumocystis jirovecii]
MSTSQNSLYTYNLNKLVFDVYDSEETILKSLEGTASFDSNNINEQLKKLHLNSEKTKKLPEESILKDLSKIETSFSSDEILLLKNLDKSYDSQLNEHEWLNIHLLNNDLEINNTSKTKLLQKNINLEDGTIDSSLLSFSSIVDCYSANDYKDNIFIEEVSFLKEYTQENDSIKHNILHTTLNESCKSSATSDTENCIEIFSPSLHNSLKSSTISDTDFKKSVNSDSFHLIENPNLFPQVMAPSDNKVNMQAQLQNTKSSIIKSLKYRHIRGTSGLSTKIISSKLCCIKKTSSSSLNSKNTDISYSIENIQTKLPLISQKKVISDNVSTIYPTSKNILNSKNPKMQILENGNASSMSLESIQKNISENFYTLSKKKFNTKSKCRQDNFKTVNVFPLNISGSLTSTIKKNTSTISCENKCEKNTSKFLPKSLSRSSTLSRLSFKKNKDVKNGHSIHTQIPLPSEGLKVHFSKDVHMEYNNKNISQGQSNSYCNSKNINFSKKVQTRSFLPKLKSNHKCLEKKTKTGNISPLPKLDLLKVTPVFDSLHEIFKIPPKEVALSSDKELCYPLKQNSKVQSSYNVESDENITKLKLNPNTLYIDDFDNDIIKDEFCKLKFKKQKFQKDERLSDFLYNDKNIKLGKKGSLIDFNDIKSFHYSSLTLYEIGEINDYIGSIYFIGRPKVKKNDFSTHFCDNNSGCDDDRGDYVVIIGDHIAYRYEICSILGKGSFGQVVKCFDHKTGQAVAIKIIRNKKRFHVQALTEIKILKQLSKWDPNDSYSFIKYIDHFYFREHLCIVMELLDLNLYELIRINGFKGFSLSMIRCFTKQLLQNLVFFKEHGIIHCDLKPENILLCSELKPNIKIIDFGSSCFENEKIYTYIQSRFYRSPEVILGLDYGISIDIWSLGCILAELYTGHPIFPGEDEHEQLACIMEVLGFPESCLIEKSTRKKIFFDSLGNPHSTIFSKGKRRSPSSKTLSQAVKCNDIVFLDFLSQCLLWNPEDRLTPEKALKHKFITKEYLV